MCTWHVTRAPPLSLEPSWTDPEKSSHGLRECPFRTDFRNLHRINSFNANLSAQDISSSAHLINSVCRPVSTRLAAAVLVSSLAQEPAFRLSFNTAIDCMLMMPRTACLACHKNASVVLYYKRGQSLGLSAGSGMHAQGLSV